MSHAHTQASDPFKESQNRSQAETISAPRGPRKFERLDLEVEVNIHSDHNFYAGFTSNVSEGGLFVATHKLLKVGSLLELTFTLPGDDEPLSVRTIVRWVREHNEASDTSPGMGLQFHELAPKAAEKIQAFVRSREPLFHDD